MLILQSLQFPNVSPGAARNRSGFLNPSTTDIWGWIILHCGDCPVHCECLAASLAPTHWMLTALLTVTTKNISGHCKMPPPPSPHKGEQTYPSGKPLEQVDSQVQRVQSSYYPPKHALPPKKEMGHSASFWQESDLREAEARQSSLIQGKVA